MPKFEVGQPWPPLEDLERLERYEFTRLLIEGKHREAFNRWPKYRDEENKKIFTAPKQVITEEAPYKQVGFPRLIAKTSADMVAGGDIRVSALPRNEAAVNAARRILKQSNVNMLFWESAFNNAANGISILAVRAGQKHEKAETEIIWDEWQPDHYFPEYDGTRLISGNLVDVVVVELPVDGEPGKTEKKRVLKVRRYTPGKIEYMAYTLGGIDGQYQIEQVITPAMDAFGVVWPNQSPVEDSKVNDFLFRVIPNIKFRGKWHGMDDFGGGIDPLFDVLNNRVGRREDILDKFSSPMLTAPEDAFTKNVETGMLEFRAQDAIPVPRSGSGQDYGYLTWNAELTSVENAIKDAMEWILALTGTPKQFVGQEAGQGAESGRALKFRIIPAIAQADRKLGYYVDAMEELLFISQQLEVEHGIEIPYEGELPVPYPVRSRDSEGIDWKPADYVPERVELSIEIGIPVDATEASERAKSKLESKLATHEDAYIEANPDIDPSDVGEKIDQIKREQRESAMSTTAPRVAEKRANIDKLRGTTPEPAPANQKQPIENVNARADRLTAGARA